MPSAPFGKMVVPAGWNSTSTDSASRSTAAGSDASKGGH